MTTTDATTVTRTVTAAGIGPVPVTYAERGDGAPVLLLHGGAGAQSVLGFAGLLASEGSARVITPVHPGFDGTPRPGGLHDMPGLARLYVALLDELDLTGVTVIGNSIGGWLAAEIAVAGSPRVGRVILVDAAGLQVPEHPAADFFSLTLDQVFDLSYRHPERFRPDLSKLTDAERAVRAANGAALSTYGGAMSDPDLAGRLSGISVPVLVVWGAADRMIPVEHGQAYAAAIPGAQFRVITEAGHLPQLETPGELLALVRDFSIV
jgi:pimeloyl-ACP methyl ester carboxylesterase